MKPTLTLLTRLRAASGTTSSECLKTKTKIISSHKADRIFPVVSAASIIAKVERDSEIAILREQYGDFGSGYLTDEKTMMFLGNCWRTVMITRVLSENHGSLQKSEKRKRYSAETLACYRFSIKMFRL